MIDTVCRLFIDPSLKIRAMGSMISRIAQKSFICRLASCPSCSSL